MDLDQLLRLHVIGDISGGVYTAREQPRAGAMHTASGDDAPIERDAVHDYRVQRDD